MTLIEIMVVMIIIALLLGVMVGGSVAIALLAAVWFIERAFAVELIDL